MITETELYKLALDCYRQEIERSKIIDRKINTNFMITSILILVCLFPCIILFSTLNIQTESLFLNIVNSILRISIIATYYFLIWGWYNLFIVIISINGRKIWESLRIGENILMVLDSEDNNNTTLISDLQNITARNCTENYDKMEYLRNFYKNIQFFVAGLNFIMILYIIKTFS